MAAAILDKKVTLSTFTDEMVLRPEIAKIFSKIRLRLDEKLPPIDPKTPQVKKETLTVRLKDGTVHSKIIGVSKGHWSLPVPVHMLDAKYRDCASQALPQIISHLPGDDDIALGQHT